MATLIESHYQANKDRIRVRESAVNGSWMAINRGPLSRYAYRHLQSWEDAEDAVQEAYARAMRYIGAFKEEKAFEAWFFIILARVVTQTRSNKGATPEMVELDDEQATDEFLTEVADPENYAVLAEWSDHIDKLQYKLSHRDQDILKFYFIYGHTMPEISELSGVNIHTVDRVIQQNRHNVFGR